MSSPPKPSAIKLVRLRRATQAASGKKNRQPPRPYPLLAEGQDPTSVEARVAYHLHRLRLTGRKLRDCKFCPTYQASEVAQARMQMGLRDVERLAGLLGVAVADLTRPLSREEDSAWSFYRVSAASGERVWQRARHAWESRGMSLTEAARIMGLERSVVTRNTRLGNKRGYRVFPYESAERLSAALGLVEGAKHFISRD